jgi:hypothetical protein
MAKVLRPLITSPTVGLVMVAKYHLKGAKYAKNSMAVFISQWLVGAFGEPAATGEGT